MVPDCPYPHDVPTGTETPGIMDGNAMAAASTNETAPNINKSIKLAHHTDDRKQSPKHTNSKETTSGSNKTTKTRAHLIVGREH